MLFPRTLLALAVGLPVVVAAADPGMMNLVMPDASIVMEINVARIAGSPFGAAIGDSIRQGASQQMKAQLAQSKPDVQEKLAQLAQVDWSKDVQDILVAAGTGKTPAMLIIVRTALSVEKVKGFPGWAGSIADYEGVPVLVSSKEGNGVVAFVEDSILVIGQPNDVQAAVHRRKQHTPMPASLSAQMAKYGQYDFWLASAGSLPAPPITGEVAKNPAALQVTKYLSNIGGFNAGIKFSPDFDLTANVEGRTLKATNDLADGLRWITDMMRSQAKASGKPMPDALKYQVAGNHILLSVHVPEKDMVAGLRSFQAGQAAAAKAAVATRAPDPAVTKYPPSGMISVQSSEGTVLIPVGKAQ